MKRIVLTIVLLLFVGSAWAAGGPKGFGLGLIIGEPTGPSFKAWLSSKSAIDGAAAWSLDKKNALHLHADYLLHNFTAIKVEKGSLPIYFGIGGRIRFEEDNDDDIIGVRFPVGLEYYPAETPLGIFIEAVPVLDLAPDTDFDMEGAIGIRYFF